MTTAARTAARHDRRLGKTGILAAALFLGAVLVPAFALQPQSAAAQAIGNLQESDEPLEINAEEGIEWNRNDKTYIARGNARAASGDVEVRAEVLTAYYRDSAEGNSEIFLLEATGNVEIHSPEGIVYGDKGQYDIDKQVFTMTGEDLRLEGEKDRLTARDSLEYWETKQQAVARGNARAYHEDKQIRADVLTANFVENADNQMEVRRIDATGNVEILTAKEYARGSEGTYFVDRELATLTGDVKITQGENQLDGKYAEVNMATGVSKLLGTAPGSDQPSGRVSAIVLPKSKPNDPTAENTEEEAIEEAPVTDGGTSEDGTSDDGSAGSGS
ncbi:LptA/OstA family protein [Pelagibius sp.]|uniref:LptA/OstA family protein n=1 Tax=Pelagibius sp. TaxID=1931238 RepID=UPI0026221BBB|nr:LptA/OstA family protein [Pelagibius sp.]